MRASHTNQTKQTGLTLNKHIRGERTCRNLAVLLSSFLLAFVFASIFTPVMPSSAATCNADGTTKNEGEICGTAGTSVTVNIENSYFISVSSSHGSAATPSAISLDYTAADTPNLGSVIAASDRVVTTTNTGREHYLYISTTSDGTTTQSNNLVSNDTDLSSNKTYIAPGGGNTLDAAATLSDNTWGFAIPSSTSGLPSNSFDSSYSSVSNSSKFTKVPALGDDILIQSENTSESTADVYYGALATIDLYANTYSNTIRYTAFSESPLSIPTMQDFTTAECNALPEATADNYSIARIELRDVRDNKIYTVARMKDGNCWMTANLALNPGRTLTPEDSNVTTNRGLPASASIDGNGTTPSEYDTPQVITTFQNTTDSYGSKYGNYYNWNAATATVGKQATTGTVYESVCPRGWRLPDNEGDKSYSNLMGNYDLPTSNVTDANAVAKVQQSPLYFPLAGRYYSGMARQGMFGFYWSRTVSTVYSSSDYAYDLDFNTSDSGFYPRNGNRKSGASSVRCVLGE